MGEARKTTAYHRALARELADAGEWRAAAYHMKQAITLYPGILKGQGATPGTLVALDLERMGRRAAAWERIADKQGLPTYLGEWSSDGRTLIDPEF